MASSSPAPSIRSDASPDPPDVDTFDGAGENADSSKPAKKKEHTNKAPAKKTLTEKPAAKKTTAKQRFTSSRPKADREVRKPGGASGRSYQGL